jgi:hypothetical protein
MMTHISEAWHCCVLSSIWACASVRSSTLPNVRIVAIAICDARLEQS